MAGALAAPPPVPTTSVFSRTDVICAWQTCINPEGEQVENIEVYGSHCGLGHHPAAVYAVADRLAQLEGQWKKFDRSGWKTSPSRTGGGINATVGSIGARYGFFSTPARISS
jgi:hypothetical protein